MRKASLIILLFCLVFPATVLFAGETSRNAGSESGHLDPDSCSINLGVIRPDTIAEGKIFFRNTGNAPLQILSIFSDCGCTTSSYPTDPIEPGKRGEIDVRFNSKGRLPGPFRKALRIRSNADNPRLVIVVRGEIGKD